MADYEEVRQRHADLAGNVLFDHLQHLSWTPEEIEQEQTARLRTLLRTAVDGSSWHRDRLRDVDVDQITRADLEQLPVMTKDDLMAHWDEIVTDPRLTLELVNDHLQTITTDTYLFDEVHAVASGGSSGQRGVFAWGWDAWARASVCLIRWPMRHVMAHHPEAMAEGPPVLAMLSASAPTHMSGAMRQTFGTATMDQRLSAMTPLPEIVAALNELQPNGINGYASVLYELAREALAGRLRIEPRLVTTDGEPLLPEMRAVLEQAWGVPVGNVYGTSEGCVTAASCYDGAGMHLSMDLHVLEPVDRDRRPVAAGVLSDTVLLTNLVNPTLPLIRYEITDRVRVIDEPCPCGCAFTRIDDIEGRLDHVFTYADGTVVHPHVFRSPLSQVPEVVEYQVRQTATGADVDIRLAGSVDLDGLRVALSTHLHEAGLADPEVSLQVVTRGDRTAAGKQRRFVPLDLGGRERVIFTFAERELDTATHELRHCADAEPIPMEPQVFAVLRALVEHADRVVSKEELLDTVWGTRFVSESALTSRIKDARKAVGDDGRAQQVIRTVHGTGYRLVAPVRAGHDHQAPGAAGPTALLERDEELGALGAAVDAARAQGVGTIVLIAGEAGLGKTTLVRAFADGVRTDDLPVLVGGCDDLVTPRTMGPLRDIARELGGPLAAALAGDADPEQVFAVLPDVLAARPTVLVIEDLHWADDATLDVIRFLSRHVPTLPTVLVGTYREEELGEGHRLRRVLGSLPTASVRRLTLAPLSVDAVATLALDADIPAGELHAATRGNPFFVTEVLASGSLSVSPTVRDAVLSRIDALGPSARDLLQHAAVVPSRVERWLLAELAEDADAAVAESERAGVLGGDEQFAWFRHELARQAVEQSLTAGARLRANQRVLEVLVEHDAEPTRLVHHAHRGGDVDAVIRHCPVAAAEAIRLGAYSQAIHLLELLLAHADHLPKGTMATVESQLAYSLYMVNRFAESAVHGRRGVVAAEAAGDRTVLADALLWLSRTLYWSDGPRTGAAAIERALPLLEGLGDEVRLASAHTELARAHSDLVSVGPVGEPDPTVVRHAEQALELAERLGNPYLRCHALQYRGTGRIALGDLAGTDDLAAAVELAHLDPRDELPARACVNASGGSYRAGRLDDAERYVRLGLERAGGGEFAAGTYRLELTLQGVRLSRGEWAEAEEGLRMLIEWPGEPGLMRPLATSLLVRLLARQGRHDEAAGVLQPALDEIAGSSEIAVVGPVTAAQLEAAWLRPADADLLAIAAPAVALATRFGHRSTQSELARLLLLAGQEAEAPRDPVGPWAPALAGRWLEAADAWDAIGCRYEQAVERAVASDDHARAAGHRELTELGAAGTLAALD